MSKILVADVMTKEVVTVDISQTVSDISKIITEKNIRHIPVMENGKIIGMVSKSDYQRLTYNTYTTDQEATDELLSEIFKLEDLMCANPYTVTSNTNLIEAIEIFTTHEFHALPVVDNEQLIGIISTTDILRLFAQRL